jgi:ABC-type glycerol-3-phosphate transport system substrate-binding protein
MFLLSTSSCERSQNASTGKTITVWYSWGNDLAKQLRMICDDFEKTHPGVHVQLSYSAYDLTSKQKLFLAIAGGVGPDVTFVDGQQLSEWAARGAMEDITDEVKAAHLGEKNFWLPRWQESNFAGRTYALPWGADPNFALVWNKSAFREVGLDPNRPPQTIDELAEYAKKLTKYDSRGQIVRIGFIPWEYEFDNCMFTFGYLFGGEFYHEPAESSLIGQVTANDPHNVAALRWLNEYARQYDVRKMTSMHENAAGLSNHPFYIGAEAMALMHITQMHDMNYYAPTMDYGVGYLPPPPGGEQKSGWIGGWSLAIPRGSHVSKEAFEFIRWMCTDDAATMAMGKYMTQFPACKRSPYFATIQSDPRLDVYYEILKNSKHARTMMPVQGYLMTLLDRGVADVLYGQRDPQQVLDEVTRDAQARLEHVVGRMEQHE